MDPLTALALQALFCLIPLDIYCLALTYVIARGRPTALNGGWDFACVLLGLSGILLVGGPVAVGAADSAYQRRWLAGEWAEIARALADGPAPLWSWLWGAYFAACAAGAALLIALRSRVTVAYNVDPGRFPALVAEAAGALNRGAVPRPAGVELAGPGGGRAGIEVELIRSMRHATLRFTGLTRGERRAFLAELDARLEAAPAPPRNPFAGWLTTAAVTQFVLVLFCLLLVIAGAAEGG